LRWLWTPQAGAGHTATAGKKVKERKRHILTDTQGFLVTAIIHSADIQDRDGVPDVLKKIRFRFPWLRHVSADGGYAGDKLKEALAACGKWTIEIIKRSDTAKGFVLLPRRWVVERTLAGLGRNRRLAKDFEKSIWEFRSLAISRRNTTCNPQNCGTFGLKPSYESDTKSPIRKFADHSGVLQFFVGECQNWWRSSTYAVWPLISDGSHLGTMRFPMRRFDQITFEPRFKP
jgi:transposase